MNLGRGRARRPDDWPSSHVRARADLSERLDGSLDPTESDWLESHLGACPDCRAIDASYAAQQLELRAMRDVLPPPPRDLWARTAAAIESEARFRDGRARTAGWRDHRYLAPSVLLASALVVAVVVGTLTSSRWFPGGGGDESPGPVALASAVASSASGGGGVPGATPIPAAREFAYLTRDADGDYNINVRSVGEVCPETTTEPCATDATVVNRPVALKQDTSTVFGSPDDERLIVVNDGTSTNGGTVSVVSLASSAPGPTPSPSVEPTIPSASVSPSAVTTPSLRPSQAPAPPSATPSLTPQSSAGPSPTPSVTVTPSPDGSIEIAHDVVLVGQSAAYSASGDWFAFTARPVDGSAGPDIFAWKVGEARATRVTNDQRSIFGSWSGDVMVGSTVVPTANDDGASPRTDLEPASFLLDPATATLTDLPQTGKAWRPAVGPRGRLAVYWTGTVRTTSVPGFAPDAGRLVLGDWGTGTSTPSGPLPTTLKGDQVAIRHETTIAAGRMEDWDARWDSTGTHLAVWIVDALNPSVGRLSLYAVDSFDGRIDLKKPILDRRIASAGYSISDGKLVWAEPAADGSAAGGTIQLLAWTDEGVGTVETVTGPVIVIR
jgi:anti-sigma factor RsiW